MNVGRTIFSQLLDYFPRTIFRECVARYNGEKSVKGFSCFDQWLCLAYGQLAGRMSLRDIVTCLTAFDEKPGLRAIQWVIFRSFLEFRQAGS